MLAFISLNACDTRSAEELLQGKWSYKDIRKEGKSIYSASDIDFLEFNNDSFRYFIMSMNKNKQGTWSKVDGNLLELHYIQPDTVRTFEIRILSAEKLLLTENEVDFEFKKD